MAAHPWSVPPAEVQVWHAQPEYSATAAARYLPLLAPAEAAHAQRLRFSVDRWRAVVARAYLRLLLARYLGCAPQTVPLSYGPYGKPLLAGEAAWLQFNLSHAGGLLLCAVARDVAVGVDVEVVNPTSDWLALARRVFDVAQVQRLLRLPPAQRAPEFYQIWSLHEALLKAVGCGFASDSRASLPDNPVDLWHCLRHPNLQGQMQTWSLRPLAVHAACRAAVAVRGVSTVPPVMKHWEENAFEYGATLA